MTPADVRKIKWENLFHIECVEWQAVSRKPSVIRLLMWMNQGQSWGFMTTYVHLKRAMRNDTMRRLLPVLRETWNNKKVAFLMGTHARLGEQSLVHLLDPSLVQLVCRFV